MARLSGLFWFQAAILFFVAAFHGSAEYFSWYYMHPSLDIPMHYLGGLWAGLVVYWFLRDVVGYREKMLRLYVFLLISVLFIGLIWECFELFIHVISIDQIDMQDSFKDICMDLFGGFTACTLIKRNTI
jgi:uncharacterized membrane protein YjdF